MSSAIPDAIVTAGRRTIVASATTPATHGSVAKSTAAVPVDSLGAARYEGGELVLEDRQGNRMFEGVNVNGTRVMQAFPAAEGRRFAEAVRREIRRRGR